MESSFTQAFFEHTSKCLKKLRGIEENVWSAEKCDYTEIVTPEGAREAMAYTLVNPTAAGLVRFSKQWPGVRSTPRDLFGHSREIEPPPFYFKNAKPKKLRFTPPPMLRNLEPVDQTIKTLRARIKKLEGDAANALKAEGRSFLGLDRLAKTDWRSSPTTKRRDRKDPKHRSQLFKTLNGPKREKAEKEMDAWLDIYDEIRKAFRAGNRDVFWPAGTWHMRVHRGCPTIPYVLMC